MFLTLIVSVALCGTPRADPRLVGAWLAGGEPFFTFAADGTGTMEEGKLKWSTEGATVTITDDLGSVEKARFVVDGDALTLTLNGLPVALHRAGVGVKKQSAPAARANQVSEEDADREAMAQAQAWLAQHGQGGQPPPVAQGRGQAYPQQPAAQPRGAGNDQLSQLLLSGAWCSFSFNKISGASSQTRVVYFRNGTWALGGQRQTYNSGANGSMAGQYNSNNGGLWEVRGGQLFMSSGQNPVQLIQPFSVTLNSSGNPIINSLGKEYSRCN